jgi:hypothetical protein
LLLALSKERFIRPVKSTLGFGIDTPTLLILGQLDYAIPHLAWEDVIGDLPSLTYVLLDEDQS